MVEYEWDVETVDEYGDIEHEHCASYADCLRLMDEPAPEGCRYDVVLVRDDDYERSWAYMENNKLPEYFKDVYGRRVVKVPKRFVAEVAKVAR